MNNGGNMYCGNCGSELPEENSAYCNKCGAKIENAYTETFVINNTISRTKPVKETAKDLQIMGYILTFLPLLGLITMWIPDDIYSIVSPAITGLNIGLWYTDKTILKKHGYTGKWTWWGIIFYPIYLYFRCKNTDRNYSKLICNVASIVLVFTIALIPIEFEQQHYNETYEWWLKHSSSFDKDTYGTMAADYNATFVSNKNEYIKLYAYENRDGSVTLNFNILITGTGEELQILGTDSYQVKYSVTDNKHCWTYENTNLFDDEVVIIYSAEDRTLNVTSMAELLGLSGNQYSHTITGTYRPILNN